MASDSFWTPDKEAKLRELLKSPGLSAGDIGQLLGGITRSAVLGKIHRMKLPWIRRDTGTREKRSEIYGGSSRRAAAAKLKAKNAKSAEQRAVFNPITNPKKCAEAKAVIAADGWRPPPEALPDDLKTLAEWDTDKKCMAPYLESPVRFGCQGDRVPGLSYCQHHAKRYIVGEDPRRKLAKANDKTKTEEMA